MSKDISIGWSTKSITPYERKVSLMGQFYERISDRVDKELTATALAIDNENYSVTWVSCDLANISSVLSDDVQNQVEKRAPELKTGLIVLSATHTHTAPYIKMTPRPGVINTYSPPDGVMGIGEYHDFAVGRIADAVIKANNNKSNDYYLQSAVSPVQTGCCRRGIINTGEAVMYIDTSRKDFLRMEGPDSGPSYLLYIRDNKNELKGVIACIPCTAQVLEHQYYMSSDYIGRIREMINNKYGEDFLFLPLIQSTGNLSPRNLVTKDYGYGSMYDKDGADNMAERVFRGIIDEVDNPTESIKDFSTFKASAKNIRLPGWLPTEEEYTWALSLNNSEETRYDIEEYVQKGVEPYFRTPLALSKRVNAIITKYEHMEEYRFMDTEIAAVRLGNIAWVSNPFELYMEYANRILTQSKAKCLWSIQKTNDHLGYLPTEASALAGGYSGYIANGWVQPGRGGEKLVEESVNLVNSLFEQ